MKTLLFFLIGTVCFSYGPYRVDLIKTIDGDTYKFAVHIWPGLTQVINLRVNGINTPEKRTRRKCEKAAGIRASEFGNSLISKANDVIVHDVKLGKFAGRVLGKISVDGKDLGEIMILAGHAKPYFGGRRGPWCEDPE